MFHVKQFKICGANRDCVRGECFPRFFGGFSFGMKKGRAYRKQKVSLKPFQRLAGFEGAAPLIDLRRGRNTQDFDKSSFFRFLFSSLKEKRKNNILEITKRRVADTIFRRKCDTPKFIYMARPVGQKQLPASRSGCRK